MPNWCNNSITISGPTETIKQLWEDAQTSGSYKDDEGNTVEQFGLLNAMAPSPDLESKTDADGMPNWWTWRVNNWGTKWDVSDEGLEFIDNGDGTADITGWFDSAWAPPIGAYEQFCDDMDNCDLEASYHEPGMDFAGFWSSEGGDEYCDELTEQCELPEDERSDLFNRLDEEYALVENYEMWKDDEEMAD